MTLTPETVYGGSVNVPVTSPTKVLAMGQGRIFYLSVSGSGIGAEVDLPDARTVPLGSPALYIYADGGGVTIQDALQNPLFSLADGEVARMSLADNSAADGAWAWRIRTAGSPPSPTFQTRALVAGGDGAADDETREFVPHSSAWSNLATAPRDLTDACAATDGRKVWVFGSDLFSDQDKIEEYDRAADSWTTKATDFPHTLQKAGAVFLGGFIYVFGGVGAGNLRKAYRYNPNDETFLALTDVPGTDTDFQALMVGKRMHILGPTSHFVYDPELDNYEVRAVRPGGLFDAGLAFFWDRLLAVGGDNGAGDATGGQTAVDFYSYSQDKWTAYPALPSGRARCGAVHLGARRLIAFGGDDGTGGFGKKSEAWIFDGSSWATATALPAIRTDLHRVSVPVIA